MGVATVSDIITGIQQALNDIDRQAMEGDWQTRFEVMTLLLGSVNYIMSEIKNETKPKQKTIKKTNYIPFLIALLLLAISTTLFTSLYLGM